MLTGIPETIEAARRLSLHGMSRDAVNRYSAEGSWHYEVDRAGFKFNMTDIQAAIGLHQLRKQGAFLARRAEIARRYNVAFSIEEGVQIPARPAHLEHAWHIYSLRLRLDRLNISRNEFIEELAARKISASVHFMPVHLHPYFRDRYGYRPENMPTASREYLRILSLPIFPSMTDEDVEDVTEAVAEIARKHRRRRLIPTQQGRHSMRGIPADRVIRAGRIKSGLRRAFDMFASASGLLLLAPLLGIIALAIKWQDGGPVLYVQSRVGRGFRKFQLYKFRSMVADAPSSMPLAGPRDPRITRVGKFLRKHKLDELPQLLNVLKGEMQLVGVRPQLERYVLIFPDEYRDLLQERPGITDLASLKFRNEEQMFRPGSLDEQYVQQILPEKLRLALKYRRARTFVSDLGILFRTVLGFKSPSTN